MAKLRATLEKENARLKKSLAAAERKLKKIEAEKTILDKGLTSAHEQLRTLLHEARDNQEEIARLRGEIRELESYSEVLMESTL